MTPEKPFSLHTRTPKNGKKIYYVQFRQPDGSYATARSTGQTSRGKAEGWAYEYLKKNGRYFKDGITLAEYAEGFFGYEGPWARNKRITGQRLSEKWCVQRQRLTDKYLIPALGKYKISEITKPVIDDLRNDLFYSQGLAGQTVNHILVSLRLILLFAEERGLLGAVPTVETVKGDAVKPKREKGTLTVEEAQQVLFSVQWSDYAAYVFALTAALTGARKGELLAIQLKNIKPGYIEIQKTWDTEFSRLTKTTKNGKSRNVVITDRLQKAISKLVSMNLYGEPESFLFFSPTLPEKPIDNKALVKHFYRALHDIGITELIRKERCLSFHALRYFANTLMINARLPLQQIQATTGHLTDRMTEHYYSVHADDMEGVRQIQDSIFLSEPVENEENKNLTIQ